MTVRVLSLCDRSGVMVRPWAEAGAECVTVDTEDAEHRHPGIAHVRADVCELPDLGAFDVAFAFPPCTHLSVSGARWWKGKDEGCERAWIEATRVVRACWRRVSRSGIWMIENPVGRLVRMLGPADHTFQPCDYGDPYTKRTCPWVGGMFTMPERDPVMPTMGGLVHRLPPGPDRARLRSITPEGFARAVFAANAAWAGIERAA